MDTNLTIVLIIMSIIILWLLAPLFDNKSQDDRQLNSTDRVLIKNYHKKSSYKKKVVLVIEETQNVNYLITLIRNLLTQDIKVDSIILISRDDKLKKYHLIRDTCIINKVGGLTFLFKESSNNTIIVFIYPSAFSSFTNPRLLREFLDSKYQQIDGLIKVETNTAKVNINKIYHI
jgi:hypothetical protein